MYTHELKTSGLKCFKAAWFPTSHDELRKKERDYPMVMLESGQVTRVRADNLRKIKDY